MIVFALIAPALGLPVALSVASFGALWYGSEMLLAAAIGWRLSPLSPMYAMARDLMLPVLFTAACVATILSGAATKCRSSACGRAG